MIEVGNIVTLENNLEYLLLEELEHEGQKYVYAVRTLEDETPTDEFLIYEVLQNEDGEFLKEVDNRELYDNLIEMFKDIVADKVINGDIFDSMQDEDEEI